MVTAGRFYGIGVGPGDPDLLTVKAAAVLSRCREVFAPCPKAGDASVALEIVRKRVHPQARIHEVVFPMTAERKTLKQYWGAAAARVLAVLEQGDDACFLTLGDPLLYSTYIYLLSELRALRPDLKVETIPGIMSFAAAAALARFSLGEGLEPIHIVPVSDDLDSVRDALCAGGTVVLMKVGRRLADILDILKELRLIEHAVFVARAGQAGERVVADLRNFCTDSAEAGYLSVVLVHAGRRGER